MMIYILVYVLLCLLIGFAAKEQPLGAWGYGLLSLFFSPMIGLAILLVMTLYTKAAQNRIVRR